MSKKKGSLLSKIRSKPKPRTDRELDDLVEAVQNDAADMRARIKLADAYLKREQQLKALDQYLTVAETYAERGVYPKAVAVYKRAIEIDPQMIEVYIKLAQQYKKLGLMSEVVANYTKAAELHEKAGRKKEALDTFRMLIGLSQENAVGRLKLGQRYLNEGFADDAVGEFLKAAEIFERQKKFDERRKLFEGLVERGIKNQRIVHALLVDYAGAHEHQKVLDAYETLKKEIAGSVSLQELVAQSAVAVGRSSVASEALKTVIRLYDDGGHPDKVREFARQLLQVDPTDAYALDMLARAPEAPVVEDLAPEEEAPVLEEEAEIAIEFDEEISAEEEPAAAAGPVDLEEFPEELPGEPSAETAREEDMWEVPGRIRRRGRGRRRRFLRGDRRRGERRRRAGRHRRGNRRAGSFRRGGAGDRGNRRGRLAGVRG
ncbi:MAG: tetratricopeptide repeat protein [Deltaproteobacteria bacterium]|nr:tetratricopeptide repeat protein [Deltaproteobacteria bacterium]